MTDWPTPEDLDQSFNECIYAGQISAGNHVNFQRSQPMTEAQSKAAQQRYKRESEVCCPMCDGSGRILSRTVKTRALKGGNSSYLKSLQPGQMSMSERGKRGGRPRLPTLQELRERSAQRGKPERT